VGGEEDSGHAGRYEEVGSEGFAATPNEVLDGAEEQHAERDGEEWASEEAHGLSGEVEDVAEREVVEGGVGAEEGVEVGSGWWGVGGEAKVSAEQEEQGAERDEEVEGASEGLLAGLVGGVGCGGVAVGEAAIGGGEKGSDEQGERGKRWEVVVLLTRGEGEEAEDDAGPEEEGEGGFVGAVGWCIRLV